ncbi:MAG: tRNA-dependent cyclodipeptide synthase [Rhodospirillales bacterium]|nr:tRNA-dependent cyclodipeptide synthase [Rhodospirillales bacterium]
MMEFYAEKNKRNHWKDHKYLLLGISMLNPNHQGEKFQKIISWVNQQINFQSCFIYLADTLYRHNFMLSDRLSEKAAYEKAARLGQRWIENQSSALEMLNISHRIIRWDSHLNNPYYQETFEMFCKEYTHNIPFQQSVKKDIETIFARRGINTNHILPKEIRCFEHFILEELAADSIFFGKYRVASVYPGRELSSYKYLRIEETSDFANSFKNYYPIRLIGKEVDEAHIQESGDISKANRAAA